MQKVPEGVTQAGTATLPRSCIIGAGTSGLITAKVFKQRGLPFDCFEKGSGVGGLWRFENDNGMSTCYRSLHINTAKAVMQLSDFPFPEHIPEYPAHWQILQYFDNYCDHFGLRDKIQFNTEVAAAKRLEEGGWEVTFIGANGEQKQYYDMLIVANGHHWDPRKVEFPGQFDGEIFHSHHYVDIDEPVDLKNRRVVVVGSGNSAMDIVCELGQASRSQQGPAKVYLSQRSGVWITPKVLGNVAQDQALRHPMQRPGWWERFRREWVPVQLRKIIYDTFAQFWIRLNAGDPSRVGLKQPVEPYSQRHSTISQDIHSRLIHGDIEPKGNIAQLNGNRVEFEDGSTVEADVIINCTGYNLTFPFFEPGFFSTENNDVALWQRMLEPSYPDLAFVALVQPKCAMMPIAELQSGFLADYVAGKLRLPDQAAMQQQLADYHAYMKKQFTRSASHTIQIDCEEYSYNLYKSWDQAKSDAQQQGGVAPPLVSDAG